MSHLSPNIAQRHKLPSINKVFERNNSHLGKQLERHLKETKFKHVNNEILTLCAYLLNSLLIRSSTYLTANARTTVGFLDIIDVTALVEEAGELR